MHITHNVKSAIGAFWPRPLVRARCRLRLCALYHFMMLRALCRCRKLVGPYIRLRMYACTKKNVCMTHNILYND